MKCLNVTSLILAVMLINSACSNTGINSDTKGPRSVQDEDKQEEFGTFSVEDREALTTARDEMIKVHEDNLKIEEDRRENIRREIEEIDRLLGRDPETQERPEEPESPTEPEVDQDEINKRRELEALDEQTLEERLQALTSEFSELSQESLQDCQEVMSCQALLQEVRLVNDVLGEKRNEDFSEDVEHLSEEELLHVRGALEEELEAVELEKSRAENAIATLEQERFNDYQFIRVKLFPNRRGRGHFPNVTGEDTKYAKLHNNGGFKVEEVDISSNQVIRQLGQAYMVEMFFDCPERASCSENKVILDDNEVVPLSSSGRAISVTPLNSISSEGDNYFDLGFTKIEYRGVKQNEDVPYTGFYRGGFRIQFARQSKTSSENHWSVINLVSLDEYLLSVTPAELNTNEIEARKAQIIIARTYVLSRALAARISTRKPRLWDVLPTVLSQLYIGAEKERADYYQTIVDTRGQILIRGDRPALAEFFSCSDPRTVGIDDVVEQEARTVPSGSCPSRVQSRLKPVRGAEDVIAYGHGRGFCQFCGVRLAKYGWSPTDPRQPTQGAVLPSDTSRPWTADEIARYFYNDTKVSDMSELSKLSEVSI